MQSMVVSLVVWPVRICLDLAPEVSGQSEEYSLRSRVQGPSVRESAPGLSEFQRTGPGTLAI
jgi:hypothetical protein